MKKSFQFIPCLGCSYRFCPPVIFVQLYATTPFEPVFIRLRWSSRFRKLRKYVNISGTERWDSPIRRQVDIHRVFPTTSSLGAEPSDQRKPPVFPGPIARLDLQAWLTAGNNKLVVVLLAAKL